MERKIIVEEGMGAFEIEDFTPCNLSSELTMLEALDQYLRAQASELPAREFWSVMGHPAIVHLVDRMSGLEGDEYLAAYREMISAFKYALGSVRSGDERLPDSS